MIKPYVCLTLLLGLGSCGLQALGQTSPPLPYEESRFGIFGAYSAGEFGDFKTLAGFDNTQYWSWTDTHFQNLNAHWTRSTVQLVWTAIDPATNEVYNWNPSPYMADSVITNVYKTGNQLHWLGVFSEGNLFGERTGPSPLSDTNKFCRFVQAAVERYDGDGVDDVSSTVKVRYWQLGNEVPKTLSGENLTNYVNWVRVLSGTIRSADPDARIVLVASITGLLDSWSSNVVSELSDSNWFDVVDFHYWNDWDKYKMPGVNGLRQYLDALGKTNVQIWSGENGTWAYQPTGEVYQVQEDQARGLIRRFVYNIDLGLDKLFWENLVEWSNYDGSTGTIFNSMGLIGDGLWNAEPATNLAVPRVSYYAYKLLAQAIDTDKARYIGKMDIHQEPSLYAYRFDTLSTNYVSRYILWRDLGTQTISFVSHTRRVKVTDLITDAQGNIQTTYVTNTDSLGNLSVTVSLNPLLIEEIVDPPQFRGLTLQSDSKLTMELESVAGRGCVVEATTNFSTWMPLSTNIPTNSIWSTFNYDPTNNRRRFYRARQLSD